MSDETRKVAVQNRWIDETRKKKSNRVTDLAAVSKKKDGDKNNWPDNWTERRNKWMNENSTKSSKNGVYDSTKKAVRAAKLTHTVMLRSVLLARSSLEDKSPEQFKVLKQRCFVPERPGPKMFKSAAHLYKQVNVCQTCYNMYVALDAERNNTAQLDTDDPITSPWTTNWTIAPGRLETPKVQQSTLKNSPRRPMTGRSSSARPSTARPSTARPSVSGPRRTFTRSKSKATTVSTLQRVEENLAAAGSSTSRSSRPSTAKTRRPPPGRSAGSRMQRSGMPLCPQPASSKHS